MQFGNGNMGHRSGGHKTRQQHKRVHWQKPGKRKKQQGAEPELEIVPPPKCAKGTFEILSRSQRGKEEFLQIAITYGDKSETHYIPNAPLSYKKTCWFKFKIKAERIKIVVKTHISGLQDKVKYDCVIERKLPK